MIRQSAAIFVVLLALQVALTGIDATRPLSQSAHQTWTRQHGLPQDSVRAIAQTADGALWVGTDEGLARFDGVEFVRFRRGDAGLPDSTITALAPASDGSIWVGTLAGVSHFSQGVFRNFDLGSGLGTEAVIGLLHARDGTVWAAGGLMLSSIRDGHVVNYGAAAGVPPDGLRVVGQLRDGTIVAAGVGNVVRFDGGQLHVISNDAAMAGNIAQAIAIGPDDTVWIAGTRGVAAVQRNGRTRVYGVADGLPDELARAVCLDRDGNVWVGTVNGLARIADGRVVAAPAPGLSPLVWEIFEDQDGGLWVGTNSGLHQFRDQPLSMFGVLEGYPSDQPSAVHQTPDGAIWIGFRDAGVMRVADGRRSSVTRTEGLASNEVFAIRSGRGGAVLVATRTGLTVLKGSLTTTIRPDDPLGRHMVYDVLEDDRGRRWLATAHGVVLVEGLRQQVVLPAAGILNESIVTLARAPDGTLWAGSFGNGLWRYRDGQATRFTTADGLSSNAIRSLLLDSSDGTLWIGTAGGGLAWLRSDRFGHIGSAEGFESDNVGQLVDDGTGHLWVGTAVGLARLQKQRLLDESLGDNPSRVFIEFGGLRSSHAASTFPVAAGGMRAHDGRLWFTTANGVAVLDTTRPPDAPSVRPPTITNVLADGRVVTTHGEVHLTPDSRQLDIRYAAVSLSGSHLVRYRYRLSGVDADWIDAGPRRSAVYGQLPPGRYRFEVIASAGGAAAGPAATIEVIRAAAWHEAAWFPLAVAFVVLGAAIVVHRARARRAQERFALVLAERSRISRDLHDTLSQHVVGIASQLGAVANTLRAAPEDAERHLAVARRMAQHSLKEARRTIMDLRSAPDGRDLRDIIDDAVQPMAAGLPATVVVRGSSGDRLSTATRQHLLRIAQEATANALAHAQPRVVTVDLSTSGETVSLVVHDDGVGFDPAKAASAEDGHFGLVGLRERAAQLGGECAIESSPGKGTTVSVKVPVS